MPVITSIDDLKRIYKRRVPKMFYDYAETGSWTEQTFRENSSDFDHITCASGWRWTWRAAAPQAQMIGQDVAMPVALAPVGLTGMQHADGEIKAARAAEKFGVPFTLSTMSICSIEDVAENTTNRSGFRSTRSRTMISCSACSNGPRRRNARPLSSRWICKSWDSGTRT